MTLNTKPKFDLQLMIKRIFQKKVLLDPQPDGSFKAITINGLENGYYKDDKGATFIHPGSIREVSGLKNVKYICMKDYDATELADMFAYKAPVKCPSCEAEVWTPAGQMTEKMFADIIDIAESAGRLQAEKENSPAAGSKMNLILMAVAGLGILLLWQIINAGGN